MSIEGSDAAPRTTVETTTDVLDKIKAMQKRAADNGNHGYASVLAEAAAEINRLRVLLAQAPQGWRPI